MFGKLKDAAQNGAVQKLLELVAPELKDKLLDAMDKIDPSMIKHDESFEEKVINPIKLSILAASSGATKLIPQFDAKFRVAMLHLRDELIEVSDTKISLAEGFDKKLPDVLKSGFEKAKQAA
jgi:hypothetical protein